MDDRDTRRACANSPGWPSANNYPDLTYAIVDPATGAVEEVLRGVDALLGLVDARNDPPAGPRDMGAERVR